jgi:galactokinase
MSLHQFVTQEFGKHFGGQPDVIVRAPGRVNLIGEHTDYNDGFVLPMAIDRAVWIALRMRDDQQILVYSPHYKQAVSFDLSDFNAGKSGWIEYVRGVAWALHDNGNSLRGWEGVMAGDVPIGAGLSSSAALELATARALCATSGLEWNAPQMARIGQKAENQWVGINCGIMDQMISAAAQRDHALLIDCRSLETQLVPLPSGTAVIVLDTVTRRGLGDTAYNERRAQCEEAAQIFGVKALRDVTLEQFNQKADQLSQVIRKRARHVITENDRTVRAVEAMRQGNSSELGRLMVSSHQSLRDDFEVSSDALNAIVTCAMNEATCYGARMTGGGFGGCAVALIQADTAQSFVQNVKEAYQRMTQLEPSIYICRAANGAEVVG